MTLPVRVRVKLFQHQNSIEARVSIVTMASGTNRKETRKFYAKWNICKNSTRWLEAIKLCTRDCLNTSTSGGSAKIWSEHHFIMYYMGRIENGINREKCQFTFYSKQEEPRALKRTLHIFMWSPIRVMPGERVWSGVDSFNQICTDTTGKFTVQYGLQRVYIPWLDTIKSFNN